MAGKKVNRLIVPNVYTVNGVEPVTSVNNILPINGNVTLPIPTVPTNVSAFTNDAGYLTSATLDGYATQSWVQQQGYLTSVPSQYITDTELSTTLADYVTGSSLSTTLNSYATVTSLSTETSNRMDADDSLQLQINDKYDASNPDGFISGISRSDVITALGYTPYNSSNPNGYITSAALSDYVTDTDLATTLADYAQTTDIPTVGNGTITINQGGVQKGTFTVNQSGNSTINLDAVGSVNSVNGQTGTVVLTASDVGALPSSTTIPTKTSDLTNDSGFITNSALSPYVLSSSLATVATSGSYSDLSNKPTIPAAQIQSDWNQTDNTAVDFIKNKPIIPSGVLVDQTYDSTSANAQSGVAIAGAGFLTSIPSSYLQNTATFYGSLTILGDTTTTPSYSATSIGRNSLASSYSTAIGYEATAGENATAIGYEADATANSAIQIGYGASSTANTLNIGFYNNSSTHYNWQLLDGTTGLIPDARISSNIARASAIPTVPTNISAFTNDSGYITGITSGNVTTALGYTPAENDLSNVSSIDANSAVKTALDGKADTDLSNLSVTGQAVIDGKADTDLSNLSTTGKAVIDGQWVSQTATIVENLQLHTNNNISYTISQIPNDGYKYEAIISCLGVSTTTSGQPTALFVSSSELNYAQCVYRGTPRSTANVTVGGSIIIPLGTDRGITIQRSENYYGTANIYLRGYRRIGSNT